MSNVGDSSSAAYDKWSKNYDSCENSTRDLDGRVFEKQKLQV